MMKKCAACFLLLLLGGCARKDKDSRKPLKIGLVTWIGYGPFYVASEKGFFAENNLSVQLERIEGDVERRAAIASGRLDGIALTLDSMIVLRTNGIPLKTVMAIDVSNGGDGIVAVNEIKTIDDLKGRQIVFPTGLPSHFFLYSALKTRNLHVTFAELIRFAKADHNEATAATMIGRSAIEKPATMPISRS